MIEVVPSAVVAGGDALARDADGRVVFVPGALPGERVQVEITSAKKGFARARLVDVLEPSSWRVDEPCPHVARGCGGCQWQHVTVEGQRELKREIVRDALRRIAKIDTEVDATMELPATGYRTTARVVIDRDGRAAFRREHSHDLVPVDSCLVAHPLLEELIRDGRFDRAREVELRVGARTGERMAVVLDGSARRLQLPDDVRIGAKAAIHEEAGGRRWRISAGSFFQARPDGADVLVDLVRHAAADARSVVDLYGGVGLFGATADSSTAVTIVEGKGSAAADARHNLRDRAEARVVHADVRRWRPEASTDVVVADPSRHGLDRDGVETVVACDPQRVVLVSCDAAALGRDARLLIDQGFVLQRVTPVDLFPHTFHVEVVSTFGR